MLLLPPALWNGRTVESILGDGVDLEGPMSLPHRCDSGKSRLGLVSRDGRRLKEEHRLSGQLAFPEPQSFFVEIPERSNDNTFRA
jgi:hypothetical protein